MKSSTAREYAPAPVVDLVDQAMIEALASGLFMQTATVASEQRGIFRVDGKDLRNFGSCSYLGLEVRPELVRGAELALQEFGTQFSFSRGYLQSALYIELEENLDRICQGHVLVTSSTTLGHISALPVLVQPSDSVIVDQFAHSSLQIATGLLHGNKQRRLRHGRMDQLQSLVERESRSHDRVWYVCDGLYSMHGDWAPLESLAILLDRNPKLWLYIDDAHSTSWTGRQGRGYALDKFAGHDRVIVALSLNKAFSAAGGALVFPDREQYWKVRRCGGPMLFSGPIQPPMLGAALASSRLHLTDEFSLLQAAELERIRRVLVLAEFYGLTLGAADETPIFFVPCGDEQAAFDLVHALRNRGFYCCASVFPAVPRKHAGIRFTISLHNSFEDIEDFMRLLAAETGRLGIRANRHRSGEHLVERPG
jgi:7-keto-8-aminopelargonate synthetase-like enzyme